jgi:hypothetical protein
MNKLFALAFFAGLSVATFNAANAVPIAPVNADTGITLVAGGCGPGWHRGPFGGCRRNYANPAAHACPRGYHIGPGGRCRGDGK